jgi:hypothetical protein
VVASPTARRPNNLRRDLVISPPRKEGLLVQALAAPLDLRCWSAAACGKVVRGLRRPLREAARPGAINAIASSGHGRRISRRRKRAEQVRPGGRPRGRLVSWVP